MSPESAVPATHPIRRIKKLADEALAMLSPTFDAMYSAIGRSSIPPERLLKATVLMALYTVRSERQFCEQLNYNLLFRWFLDMDMIEPGWEHTTFSRNRERLLAHDVAGEFFRAVVQRAEREHLVSREHFSVDGTLIEAWASLKSFKKKDAPKDQEPPDDPGNPSVDFHGEKRTNQTHASTTDPEAKLMCKGPRQTAKLSYAAHTLMENRHGLLVDIRVTEANGFAEREAALAMLDERKLRKGLITVGADKAYDTADYVAECRAIGVVPHVAQNTSNRSSAIDARTTRHSGYSVSQRIRKRIEEGFGWMKTIGNFRKTRFKGRARNQLAAYMIGAAYNLLRVAKLLTARTAMPLPEPA
jgi:transposase